MTPVLLLLLCWAATTAGTLGGIGGASLLVPLLVLSGMDPIEAAPLGLLTVGAGSIAAAPLQASTGLVHHRLGVVVEIAASAGSAVGALVAASIDADVLAVVLGSTAVAAAFVGANRAGMRNQPDPMFDQEAPGEWPGTLGGQYRSDVGVVPYQARRVRPAMTIMAGAGLLSGVSGVGGGFIKVPTMTELMHVPAKVAAATSTFTVGFTAAAGLAVYAIDGRLEMADVGPVALGGLLGGIAGSTLQSRLPAPVVRRVTAAMLAVIGVVLIVRTFL